MRLRGLIVLGALLTCVACGDRETSTGPRPVGELRDRLDTAGVRALEPVPLPGPELVELGRALFFDKILSGDADISCGTCHSPTFHTADGIPVSVGTGGHGLGPDRELGPGRVLIPRNAPDLFARGDREWITMFADMRLSGTPEAGFSSPAGDALPPGFDSILAAQAMFPVTSREEMRGVAGGTTALGLPNELAELADEDFGGIWDALMERLRALPGYREMFARAFPSPSIDDLGFDAAATAIAAFEIEAWTLLDSPFDRFLAGDDDALEPEALRGALLFFGEAGCSDCHAGPLLTDQQAHSIGAPQVGPGKGGEAPHDLGRGRETGLVEDDYAFRTPPLRNVALTGPWLHDGAYADLESVVRHHLDPVGALLAYDPDRHLPVELRSMVQDDPDTREAILGSIDRRLVFGLTLSDGQVDALLAFLEALTAPSAIDLSHEFPAAVPSGLPVLD